MKHINTLKNINNQSTLKFIILSIITLGTYIYMWGYKNTDDFVKEMNGANLSKNFFIFLGFTNFVNTIIYYILTNPYIIKENTQVMLIYISLMFFLIDLYYCFKIRNLLINYVAINFKFKLKVNCLLVFLFSYFYINYKFNTLEKQYLKNKNSTINK